LSFLLLVVILALAIYLLRRSRFLDLQVLDYKPKAQAVANPQAAAPELRLIAFGIFWFFLTLAVESSFIPIADVIFEHRLYLPSIGVATAVATLIALGREKTSTLCGGNIPLLVAAIAISALAFSTWQRNEVWQNEVRLWGDVARKSPEKSRPWYNLGTHLTDTGRPGEAIPALSRAVAIDPRHTEAWYNLGRSFLLNKQPGLALAPLRAAINLDPSMANATINLAVALIHIGKPEEAIPLLEGLKQRLPNLPEARHNLAIAYIGIHDLAAARRELAVLQRLSPQLAAILAKRIKQAEKEKGLSPQR
jgi:tetratricopeptide (TPR) repeat protein